MPKIKTIEVNYILLVDNKPVLGRKKLGQIRKAAQQYPLTENNKDVKIIKQTLTEQVLDNYEVYIKPILSAKDLGE